MSKTKVLAEYSKRGPNDEIYTPNYAVSPLIPYLPKGAVIWESTDFGGSEISKTLRKAGFEVIATGKDQLDYLEDEPNFHYDIMITNPPFSLKTEFLERSYELGKPFAMLLPLTTLEGKRRGELFRRFGIQVLVLDRRINFLPDKPGAWFNASWFCWNLLPRDLIFVEMDRG